ncbi:Rpn family recombination-promoting nuclease/putative transposase [Paraliomyxa miuraensis]|uniref:Rpn family recombination-promoting nuclease/putative transposase n=1 Tax=Paraliomyxa miuraensis TaxID=376150 RepID=UPI00389A3EB4
MNGRQPPRNIQDGFVRRVFARDDAVAVLLRHVLPKSSLKFLDLRSIERGATGFTNQEFRSRHADLMLTVRLRRVRRLTGVPLPVRPFLWPEADQAVPRQDPCTT